MKRHVLLYVLISLVVFTVIGCQQTTAQTEAEKDIAESSKAASQKSAPQQNEYQLAWEEKCAVIQASAAVTQVLSDLNLGGNTSRTRTVRTRDPKTGRTITKQVPIDSYIKSDGLSALLKTKSVSGIDYEINILLMPPESCKIYIKATSQNQLKDILKKHSNFIQQKISEAIQNLQSESEVAADTPPYPETMIFDRTVKQVASVLYNWSRRERLRYNDGDNDKYYQSASCESASRIKFEFQMRLIDDNKTKLEITASDYENKDEFNLIVRELNQALQELKLDQAASQSTAYTKTMLLECPTAAVYNTLVSWAKENSFSIGRNAGGDAFYKYISFSTAAGIDFSFQIFQIDINKTKVSMTVNDQENREEFPVILGSLEEALEKIKEASPELPIEEQKVHEE